jgi:hypothetical protein
VILAQECAAEAADDLIDLTREPRAVVLGSEASAQFVGLFILPEGRIELF